MEKKEENINKVLYFLLGTEIRPHEGEEISLATGLNPEEVNGVIEYLGGRGLVADETGTSVDPYRFGAVRVTPKAITLFQGYRQGTGYSME